MITIDQSKCVKCGLCKKDCGMGAILEKNGQITGPAECMECGHCLAICPQDAITMEGYDKSQIIEVEQEPILNPNDVMKAIKTRRSIRKYKDVKVEEDKLSMLFDAVRYTATAKNSQQNKLVLVQDAIAEFSDMVYDCLGKMFEGVNVRELDPNLAALYLFTMRYRRDKSDNYLLRNAPAVLFIANENPWDSGLAAQNVETMANALGLGVLYNGYLARVVNQTSALKEWLGVADRQVTAAMLIGYPDVNYKRSVPRKELDLIRK